MNYINAFITGIVLDLRSRLDREEGLAAMEYLVMLFALVIVIFVTFQIAGVRIADEVQKFFDEIFA